MIKQQLIEGVLWIGGFALLGFGFLFYCFIPLVNFGADVLTMIYGG
jgi:hypothetical protein